MNPQSMSGLEFLQASFSGALPRASIAETMGMKSADVEKGKFTLRAVADARHLNPMGGVHGGFAATVLDSVTACAVHSMLEAGVGYATVDLNIKMLRPVPLNEELLAEGVAIHVSRTIGVAEGRLTTADGKLLATAAATCVIRRP